MSKILGIDLGTTNSAMAFVEGGEPKIIENTEGVRTTPSIVAVSKAGERLVGLLAKRQAVTNPANTISGIKRMMGHKFSDPNVQKDKGLVPFTIEASEDGGVKVKMGDKYSRPEEVSAMILAKLKRDAEAKLGEKIEEAVITVPAYFDDSQRKATKDAGEIAGFKVRRIINEPTAAALAYGLNKKKDEQVVVYDFGGGTFDVSVLEIGGEDGEQSIQVKSTDGDSHMGGEDIDQKIIAWIGEEYKKESGIDVTKDELALQRLKEAAEKAKHELSTVAESEINIPFITSDASGPRHLALKMTRAKLEELADEYIARSIDITKRAVDASGFKLTDIDEIILVGGQTRMPKIQEEVKKLFGKEPNRSINPDEVVAIGAAVQAGIFQGDVKDVLLLDVTPLSMGIETMGGVATKVIERNTTIPTSRSQTFSTAADNQTSVEIHIVQGERELATDNKSLGRFILDGIPPAPRGMPQIEVTFDLDANGILSVKAKDKTSGKEQSIRIEAKTSLSKEDIERMKKEAEVHAEEDKKKRELIDTKNMADQLIYTAEKSLREAGDKVSEDTKKAVEEKVAGLKTVKDGDDKTKIDTASQELSQVMQKIGEEMAKATQPNPTSAEGASEAKPEGETGTDDNIKDAETK
ncbi:MAG: Chaperone protein DnaK [Candidatus Woesebacteria bacterium GW2011_GWA1_39_21b]|uniref:Chaperone protein DnaK n=2 Tax=Patescibacteria group TaxID=1783273 RepID=A0A1G2QFF2_9BACT|nr:MAG: Chaperone protein DnaK [Candidatus Woesebacteria bacterium GW2011_GWA1_39_21b]KKS77197.1 MAG: Chaperone protein DnaK [Parcubacteria group bacterium GW2011_GWB1_42_9]KKS89770.1 MAG: Chaperone protein DnaK [Parcubacteria group bacterium GW2011_GWC1_43_11b]OHA59340.1 MAG: molecular chaperone DnaK [Candidatus Vogelbacteria bacterium RIFOXYB1_FULL_42_16]